MKFIALPRTDLRVSSLCLGTADFGAGISEADSFAMLDEFFEAGGNFIDTAAIYADWTSAGKGSSERLLGRYFAAQSSRKDVLIATKGAHPDLNAASRSRMSRQQIESDLNDSLRQLGRETIDLYYLHRDDPDRPVEEIIESMESFVATGKIRYYGFSNWKQPRAEAALAIAKAKGVRGFVASQPMWSAAQPDMTKADPTLAALDDEYVKWHETNDFPTIPYSSQANGYFQKLLANPSRPLNASLEKIYDSEVVRDFNRNRAENIRAKMDGYGLSATALVLGFLWAHKFPVVPIVGPKNLEQLRDCLDAQRHFDSDRDFSI